MTAANTEDSARHSTLQRRIFWTGLVVRVLYMTLAHTYRFRTSEDHFQFGWEMARTGRALATGRGFADPFDGHTGPTAWNPPLYPLLIGAVFRIFGIYTKLSAWVLLTLNSIASAATACAIYEIASRCFASLPHPQPPLRRPTARSVALWSAWLWALYPAAMQYAVRWIWDMSLTAFLMAGLFVLALRVRGIGDPEPPARTTGLWACFGLFWGAVALSNSSLVLLLPVMGVWMLGGRGWRVRLARNLSGAALAGLLCVLTMTPWVVRNYRVFHQFIPFRDDFPVELDESLKYEHMGFPWGNPLTLNSLNVMRPEFRHYVAVGEKQYILERSQHVKQIFPERRAFFWKMTARRFYFYWVSVPHPDDQGWLVEAAREMDYCFLSLAGIFGLVLALRRRIPGMALFAWAFVLLPLPYYFVTVQARFRHPLEPLITILAVYLFQSATPRHNLRSTQA
ncbi:MAG: hypothetical protein KGK08_13870 [Acidobacteriota bacterium]|nr:hypothetical protein [Acidobacteriota bacterium]